MGRLQLVHTVLSASELGQDTEGAGLGGAGPRVPVLRVLHQTLLAGIAQRGRMILNLYDRFPAQADRPRNRDVTDTEKYQ